MELSITFTVSKAQFILRKIRLEHPKIAVVIDKALAGASFECDDCSTYYGAHHFPEETIQGGQLCFGCEIKEVQRRVEELEDESRVADDQDRRTREE